MAKVSRAVRKHLAGLLKKARAAKKKKAAARKTATSGITAELATDPYAASSNVQLQNLLNVATNNYRTALANFHGTPAQQVALSNSLNQIGIIQSALARRGIATGSVF